MIATQLVSEIESILANGADEESLLAALDKTLRHFDCVVGTIHALDGKSGMLHIKAQRGVPEVLMDKVSVIPIGKGMAGLAAERREPVQVCNLQTDESGQAKPSAKLTQMAGSISLPMLVNGALKGTLGVAKPTEYEFTKQEIELLMQIGAAIGAKLA